MAREIRGYYGINNTCISPLTFLAPGTDRRLCGASCGQKLGQYTPIFGFRGLIYLFAILGTIQARVV